MPAKACGVLGVKMGRHIWGFPKLGCTTMGVPIPRIIIIWDLDWGPPFGETTIYDGVWYNTWSLHHAGGMVHS